MIDEVPHWLDTALRIFDRAIEHGAAYSIIVGWIVAIGGTQWIKMLPWTSNNKWIIRLTALPIGFITAFSLWPGDDYMNAVRVFTALMVGVSAPWIYQVVTRLLYWKWPSLEAKLSAAPPE